MIISVLEFLLQVDDLLLLVIHNDKLWVDVFGGRVRNLRSLCSVIERT